MINGKWIMINGKQVKSNFLIIFILFLTSCSQYNFPIRISNDNKDVVMNEQKILQMVDYFSENNVYSVHQLENYFHSKLNVKSANNNEYLLENNTEVKQIELRTVDKGQILIINFTDKVCSYGKDFEANLSENYTFVLVMPTPFFAKAIDVDKRFGTVRLGLELDEAGNRCVNSIVFNTIEAFDKERFIN